MSGTGPRPWLAGLLALVYPGLGHVYIRAWGRALLWFVLTVGTTIFVVPEGILTEVDPLANPMGASEAISTATPTMGMISILMVVGFSVVDAYLTARRNSQQNNTVSKGDSDGPQTCPECGREVDPELSFCHWCTTELSEQQNNDKQTSSTDTDRSLFDRFR